MSGIMPPAIANLYVELGTAIDKGNVALTLTADAVKELFENSDQAFDVSVLEGLIGMIKKIWFNQHFPYLRYFLFKRIGIPFNAPYARIHYLERY
jgi:hypothetical protein